jgi:IclR family acetate operon transcriptional repressor
MRNADEGNLRSVNRALRALEVIAEDGELGVTELGRRLGVHKATASRLAATLADHGMLERDPVGGRYRLGFGILRLAAAAVADVDLVMLGRPVVEELAESTRETVNLGVRSGDGVVYIDQVNGARSIVSVSWVGRRTPMHCSASGKVLLAWMDEADRDRILATPLERPTEKTETDPAALRAQLAEVGRRGWGQTVGELEEGLNAVAAPVFRGDGSVLAALSVSGPAFRLRAIDLARAARSTVDAAAAISRRLGFREDRSRS